MSHGLDMFNTEGIARMAHAELVKPWHHLGQSFQEGDGIKVCLGKAKMDYQILEAPIMARLPDGSLSPVESHKLIYRSDDKRHLSVMGKNYRPVQFLESYSMVDDLLQEAPVSIQSLGVLKEGRRSFVCLKIEDDGLETVPGDMLEGYFLIADSYDGSLALTFKSVATNVVCQNTLAIALGETGRQYKSRHTTGVLGRTNLDKLRAAFGMSRQSLVDYAEKCKALARVRMSDKEQSEFHRRLILGNKKDTAFEDMTGQQRRALGELEWAQYNSPGQEIEGRKGTALGALNSVTFWTSHMKRTAGSYTENRTQFSVFGTGDKINQEALGLLQRQYQIAA